MKKYLLALAVVIAMAGVAVADVHDPHKPVDKPTKPAIEKVSSDMVIVVKSTDIKPSNPVVKVEEVTAKTSKDMADQLNNLWSTDGFVSSDIIIGGAKLDKIVTPLTYFTLNATSNDLSKDISLDIAVAISWDEFVKGGAVPAAFMKAARDSKSPDITIGGKVHTVSKDKWQGDPHVVVAKSGDFAKVTIYGPSYFFASPRKVILTKTTAVPGGGSSSGCNVGFAPMALLLGLPLFFLKK